MRLARLLCVLVVSSSATAMAGPASDSCAQLVQDFANEPAAAKEVAIGDCYKRLGELDQATRWYRDAARRGLLVTEVATTPAPGAIVAVAPPSPSRRNWKIAAWSAVGATALGLGLYAYGVNEVNDVTHQLCVGSAYLWRGSPGCTPMGMPLSEAQVQVLNSEGERGKVLADLGLVTGVGAGLFAGYALYKAYVAHPARERVVVAPMLAPNTGGAQLQLKW